MIPKTFLHMAAGIAVLFAAFVTHADVPPTSTQESTAMTQHATGTFDVKLKPFAADEGRSESPIGRMSNDKQFHGDIEGTSTGQMLMIGTATEGSAAYVSIEVISGSVHGKKGSFALQHNGVMTRGNGVMTITVVPDSGTDELKGLAGKFDITIANGVHNYDLTYTLD